MLAWKKRKKGQIFNISFQICKNLENYEFSLRNKKNKSEDVIEALHPTPKLMYEEGWFLTLKGLNVLT